MAQASNLRDLIRIRSHNRELIDYVNHYYGSALGFKRKGGQLTQTPAILIFVPKKINNKWLPEQERIPPMLTDGNGLECPTDIIESSFYMDTKLVTVDNYYAGDEPKYVISNLSELLGAPPLSKYNVTLLESLHGSAEYFPAGGRLAVSVDGEANHTGTAGCFVKHRDTEKLGILTNQHVAHSADSHISFPLFDGPAIGTVGDMFNDVADEHRFPGIIDDQNTFYQADCAYIELDEAFLEHISPVLPGLGRIGAPLPLDLNTMSPVGTRVASVGSRRGLQRGSIVAFAYEYYDGDEKHYTDYLIVGDEDVDENSREVTRTAFSNPGDSGKLIVTDDEHHNAVALLWGGWQQKLRQGKMQEDWTYAIDINYVLNLLNVDIYSGEAADPVDPAQANNAQATSTVTIKQDEASSALIIDARLAGQHKRLVPGSAVSFYDVPHGENDLELVGILGSGTQRFTLTFTNATRPNGSTRITDNAPSPSYYKRLTIMVA